MTEGVKRLFICTPDKMVGIGFFVYDCIAGSSIDPSSSSSPPIFLGWPLFGGRFDGYDAFSRKHWRIRTRRDPWASGRDKVHVMSWERARGMGIGKRRSWWALVTTTANRCKTSLLMLM
jgi:hypothetical protein